MILRVPPTNLLTSITRVSTGFLNTVNDPSPGLTVAPSGTGAQQFSQLGNVIRLNHELAARASKTTIGTLYAGDYMYVQVTGAATASGIRGRLALWDTLALTGQTQFHVTGDVTTASQFVAGVFLNTVTKGNYCWIQISGLAGVLNAASLVNATLGNVAFVEVALTGAVAAADFNTLASLTIAQGSSMFGQAYALPVAGSVTLVNLF